MVPASDYAFHREGRWSSAAPYLAALCALVCQVRPDITPELFWETGLETGTTPDHSTLPPVSRESEKEKMALRFDTSCAAAMESQGEREVKQQLMIQYRAMTGESAPEVSEAQLRELMIELMTDDAMERSAGRSGRIVNPVALFEALRE